MKVIPTMEIATSPLPLHQLNITITETLTYQNTICLLPASKRNRGQKFIVGCDDGSVTCYEMRNGETQTIFKHFHSDSNNSSFSPVSGSPQGNKNNQNIYNDCAIRCLTAGGLLEAVSTENSSSPSTLRNQIMKHDRLFYATKDMTVGLSKKGNQFFQLRNRIEEKLNHICVEDTSLWTGSEYAYNAYNDGRDVGFYTCADRILSMIVEHVSSTSQFDSILGCQDKMIRFVQGNQLLNYIPVESSVSSLLSFYPTFEAHQARLNHMDVLHINAEKKSETLPDSKAKLSTKNIVYGTESGDLGCLNVQCENRINQEGNMDNSSQQALKNASIVSYKKWNLPNRKNLGAIHCLAQGDLMKDGTTSLVVGRDDGNLEVFGFHETNGNPVQLFEKNVGEAIRSLCIGEISTPEYPEILLGTMCGRISSYTTEPLKSKVLDDEKNRTRGSIQNENKANQLKADISALKKQVEEEKRNQKAKKKKTGNKNEELGLINVNAGAPLPVNHSMQLDADTATYRLSFEVPHPLDLICLRSTVHLDIVDDEYTQREYIENVNVPHNIVGKTSYRRKETDASIQYVSKLGTEASDAKFMCVLRPSDEFGKRIQVNIRTREGRAGEILATVIARPGGARSGLGRLVGLVQLVVHPLSLHHLVSTANSLGIVQDKGKNTKLPSFPQIESKWHLLTIEGSFPLSTMQEWINLSLPEVPPHLLTEKEGLLTKEQGELDENDDLYDFGSSNNPSASNIDSETLRKDNLELIFRNAFTGSLLYCSFRKGFGAFYSTSISSLAVLKNIISREATNCRINISDNIRIRDTATEIFLDLIHPIASRQKDLSRKVALIDALTELQKSEPGSNQWMTQEYAQIIEQSEKLRIEDQRRPRVLQYLEDTILKTYIDLRKFRGNLKINRSQESVNEKVMIEKELSTLRWTIRNYDKSTLRKVFKI